MNPVILHIPHASTYIPVEEMDLYIIGAEKLAEENLRLADLHTDILYNFQDAARAVFPVSRFVVDAERFSDDAHEAMAARGMGALYKVGTDLSPIRPEIPDQRRRNLMDRYYWPHHNALDALASERLVAFNKCLVFDCHSYPSRPLPYEMENVALPRPEIGIGTDGFHTPPALREALADGFAARGYEVLVDTPFTGALVPNAFYGRDKRVQSVMIEVRRDLYMDEKTGARHAHFPEICADLSAVMMRAAELSL